MRARWLISPLMITLTLSACGDEQTSGLPGEEGAQAEYSLDGVTSASEETSTSIKGPDGQDAVATAGGDGQSSLPEGFSIYPGAKVVENSKVAEPGGQSSVTLMLESDDDPETIAAFYKKQAEEAGMEIEIDLALDTSHTIGSDRESDGAKMTVSATREITSDATDIMLNVVHGSTK